MKSLLLIVMNLVFMGESYLLQTSTFEVALPSEPTHQKQMVDAGVTTLELNMYIVEQGTLYYIVSHSYYPEKIDLTDKERFFKGVITGMVSNYKGTLIHEENINLANATGKRVKVKLDEYNYVLVDYYLQDRTLYQLIAKAEKTDLNSTDIADYFASFKLK